MAHIDSHIHTGKLFESLLQQTSTVVNEALIGDLCRHRVKGCHLPSFSSMALSISIRKESETSRVWMSPAVVPIRFVEVTSMAIDDFGGLWIIDAEFVWCYSYNLSCSPIRKAPSDIQTLQRARLN